MVAVPFISTSCGTKTTNFDSLSDYEKYVDRWLTDTNEYKTIDSDNLDDLKWLYDNLTNEDVSFFNTCMICLMIEYESFSLSKITVDFDNNWQTTIECDDGFIVSSTWYKIPNYLFCYSRKGLNPINSNSAHIQHAYKEHEIRAISTTGDDELSDLSNLYIPAQFWINVTFLDSVQNKN